MGSQGHKTIPLQGLNPRPLDSESDFLYRPPCYWADQAKDGDNIEACKIKECGPPWPSG